MKTYGSILLALVATGCATGPESQVATAESDARPCIAHFSRVGNFMAREVSSWQEFSGIDYEKAFRNVAQATTSFGWGNVNANKDTGTITAGGGGGTLGVTVRDAGKGGVRVDAKMILRGLDNVTFTDEKAQKALCASIEAPRK